MDYLDISKTENTRAAYPLEYVEQMVPEGRAGHPEVILFLTADAFGVLPPISRLTPEQAAYHFLSGYTAKLAGTETGLSDEPQATFSSCFGAPFLPLPPTAYASALLQKIRSHAVQCFLVSTGWTGGPYGTGCRIEISHTRTMVRAAIAGELGVTTTRVDPIFKLEVPTAVAGVPVEVLHPRTTWADTEAYDRQARRLAELFRQNFVQFAPLVTPEVLAAGPQL